MEKFQTVKTTFKIQYNTQWGESLAIVLDDVMHPMDWGDGGIWSVTVNTTAAACRDYTYVVMKDGVVTRPEWSRHCSNPARVIEDRWIECPLPGCPFLSAHQAAKFDIPGWKGAGTAVPVFALRTTDDYGIGDFKDLVALVDWAAATGQSIIQLLPITDTTRKGGWKDSYPYSPVSSFALHPLYIRLQDIGIKETPAFKKAQEEVNALSEIDYPRVFREKMALVREAFERRGAKDLATPACRRFRKENAEWLDEYAQFCAHRDGNESEYHVWIQFHLDRQLSEVVAYARSKGISFKGDLPIGVSGDSADAYWHPELFNLDSSAGAPPDFFSADGQNWGFPTYNWEEMAKDDYAWWKRRLRKMAKYFDAFRIDHILGFFRIWEIPSDCVSGRDGHFNPAISYSPEEIKEAGLPLEGLFHPDPRQPGMFQPLISPDRSSLTQEQCSRFDALYNDFFYHRNDGFWRMNAMKKLPALLGATGMLACGEDLGMVPDCVPGVMDSQRILSLEMANMDKGRPWPYLSVCATSSHDMPTMRMQHAAAGKGDPEPWQVRRILMDHLNGASMLAIFPLQDWVALDSRLRRPDFENERINEPADPAHHWRYRFHRDLRDLCAASTLNADIEGLLKDSGRYRVSGE